LELKWKYDSIPTGGRGAQPGHILLNGSELDMRVGLRNSQMVSIDPEIDAFPRN